MNNDTPARDRLFVSALERGLRVLACFGPQTKTLGVAQIARFTDLPQPTVSRLCHTLEAAGYLEPALAGGWQLGIPVLGLGYAGASLVGVAELARPLLQRFVDAEGGVVTLARLEGEDVVHIQRCEGSGMLFSEFGVGSRKTALISPAGWACLAALSGDARRTALTRMAERAPGLWNREKAALHEALDQQEHQGFMLCKGLVHHEFNALAIPLFVPEHNQAFGLAWGELVTLRDLQDLLRAAPALLDVAARLKPALRQST